MYSQAIYSHSQNPLIIGVRVQEYYLPTLASVAEDAVAPIGLPRNKGAFAGDIAKLMLLLSAADGWLAGYSLKRVGVSRPCHGAESEKTERVGVGRRHSTAGAPYLTLGYAIHPQGALFQFHPRRADGPACSVKNIINICEAGRIREVPTLVGVLGPPHGTRTGTLMLVRAPEANLLVL